MKLIDPTKRKWLLGPLIFILISFFYMAWGTGLTFDFQEIAIFPNYNMLAKAYCNLRLDIAEITPEDYVLINNKRYLYFGPVPALLRLPLAVLGVEIPTTVMIALFSAGTVLLFWAISRVILPEGGKEAKITFGAVMLLNGYMLFLNTLPSIHHEAIASAMFFLMASLFVILKTLRESAYTLTNLIIVAVLLGCSIQSRMSYVFSYGILAGYVAYSTWRYYGCKFNRDFLIPACGFSAVIALSILFTFWHNYARFGDVFEFGTTLQVSIYQDYLRAGNFIRYEHLPYNLWSMFFRMPITTPHFPFMFLPAYFIKVESIAYMPYHLINGNELAASVFVLMPVLLLFLIPLYECGRRAYRRIYFVLLAVIACQVFSIAITMLSTARYYFDFLPILLLAAYLGALTKPTESAFNQYLAPITGIVSLIMSFIVPISGVVFYSSEIAGYKSPLLKLFSGLVSY